MMKTSMGAVFALLCSALLCSVSLAQTDDIRECQKAAFLDFMQQLQQVQLRQRHWQQVQPHPCKTGYYWQFLTRTDGEKIQAIELGRAMEISDRNISVWTCEIDPRIGTCASDKMFRMHINCTANSFSMTGWPVRSIPPNSLAEAIAQQACGVQR